jgi:hypothetical protein
MIEMFKELKKGFRENPKEMLLNFTFLTLLFGVFYCSMWIFA